MSADDTPSPGLVLQLAALAGLALPDEDVTPLAEALAAQAATVAPLLALDLGDLPSALDLDPRWP